LRPTSTEEVFAGRLLRVEIEQWTDPPRTREIVRHPGAAAVVPLTRDRRVVFVRQFREAVRESLLEIPAGIYDREGEAAEDAARREVGEETGYRVRSLRPLGRIYTTPGFTDEVIDLFVAEVDPEGPPEEGLEVEEIPLEEAVGHALGGRVPDAKTALALFLTWAEGDPDAAPTGSI
jgi:ADP-ribose pyrophosphatase